MEKDRIEKRIEIRAPRSRVWKALTDHRQFGAWFHAILENPFIVGRKTIGQITYPGFEHVRWECTTTALEPETYFAFTWHPYAVEPDVDYSKEPPTLVEFRLRDAPGGTLLETSESGFAKIPAHRRAEALRMNDGGWEEQIENIRAYAEAK